MFHSSCDELTKFLSRAGSISIGESSKGEASEGLHPGKGYYDLLIKT